jgi:hypothetical protein
MGCVRRRYILALLFAFALFFAIANIATAQAWLPPRGSGSVSLSYQRLSYTGHLNTYGTLISHTQSLNMGLYVEGDYSITDRLSLTAGLPYVFVKYSGNRPPPPIPYFPWEQCHCWQSGWQDFGFTARYNLVNAAHGAFALTPSVSVGVPSHGYNFRGESAVGNHLKEVRIALDVGQRLDAISPNLFVQGRYSYAFVERPIDVPNNRSNVIVEGTYLLLKRKLAVRGFASWQRTHGGLRFGAAPPASIVFPGEVNTPERLFQHDRLLRDNNFRPGGGFSYSFPRMDVFASYTALVSGTDTHVGGALTLGISWPFEFHGAHAR